MTTTGSLAQVDNNNQTTLLTVSGMVTASGTSPSFSVAPGENVTVTLEGTWVSATFVINGSNDGGTTWFALKDYLGNAISATSNALYNLGPLPLLLQFSWSGGGSTTSITGYIGYNKKYF